MKSSSCDGSLPFCLVCLSHLQSSLMMMVSVLLDCMGQANANWRSCLASKWDGFPEGSLWWRLTALLGNWRLVWTRKFYTVLITTALLGNWRLVWTRKFYTVLITTALLDNWRLVWTRKFYTVLITVLFRSVLISSGLYPSNCLHPVSVFDYGTFCCPAVSSLWWCFSLSNELTPLIYAIVYFIWYLSQG